MAAHVSSAAAVDHALLETLERDLVWRSWYGREPVSPLADVELPGTLASCLAALGLELTAFMVRGPGDTAGVVACLHRPDRTEQSFGARCVPVVGDGLPAGAVERAVYEALMIRWSMSTPAAQRAWAALNGRANPRLPGDALEHAVLAFHGADALDHWRTKPSPVSPAIHDRRPLGAALAEHTGEDVVMVDSTVEGLAPGGWRVVRIVAPGARRLPGDEAAHRARNPSVAHTLHTRLDEHPRALHMARLPGSEENAAHVRPGRARTTTSA